MLSHDEASIRPSPTSMGGALRSEIGYIFDLLLSQIHQIHLLQEPLLDAVKNNATKARALTRGSVATFREIGSTT